MWASLLATLKQRDRLDEAAVAHELQVPRQAVERLALCRRPRPQHESEDLEETALYVGTSATALAGLYRLGQALEALGDSSARAGVRRAARKREDNG